MGSDRTQGSSGEVAQLAELAQLALIPWPTRMVAVGGALALGGVRLAANFTRVDTLRLRAAVAEFGSGFGGSPSVVLGVHCEQASAAFPLLGEPEGYRLVVSPARIDIWAGTEWGVLNAVSTLRQLLAGDAAVPCCEIDDEPRFPWRGLLLDVARHFISVPALQRTVDGMAACKLNVLHLHLTDDQAFRFPSASLPLADGEQYSVAELRELVEYAAVRGIRVVPEIDLPGHSTALLAAHPWLGSEATEKTKRFGVHQGCLDPSRDVVYQAVAQLLAEVAEVFPDRYMHIGGDEVSPGWWNKSAEIQAFMEAHDLADVRALQSYFVNRVAGMVDSLGRVPVGWDEVLHADLSDAVAVQAWRGASARDRALRAGHQCIVSANYYLDLFFPADIHYGFDPQASAADLLAREDDLLSDPRLQHVAEGLRWTHQWRGDADSAPASVQDAVVRDAVLREGLLGGEACLWSELVTESVLDGRLWTRLPALAERFWSAKDVQDVDHFYRRLDPWLDALALGTGIDVQASYREWMTVAGVSEEWMPLVDLLEPVKWYGRLLGEEALRARLAGSEMPLARPYDVDTPLNRVVDGLLPESLAVRRVREVCDLASEGDADARQRLLDMAQNWQALAARTDCLAELAPCAASLGLLGEWLVAYLAEETDMAALRARLQAQNRPQGEYVLALVPMFCEWLERQAT